MDFHFVVIEINVKSFFPVTSRGDKFELTRGIKGLSVGSVRDSSKCGQGYISLPEMIMQMLIGLETLLEVMQQKYIFVFIRNCYLQ